MATVVRRSLYNNASAWDTFFNGLNCSLIQSSGGIVSIGTEFSLRLSGAGAYFYRGSSSLTGSTYNWPMVFTVCCSDNLVSIQLQDPQSRRIVLVYETFNGTDIFAFAGGGNNPGTAFFSINSLTFTDTSSNLTYSHKARLNYSDNFGYIDYTSEYLFDNATNYKSDIEDINFVACSTVSSDQVITFGSHNYYSIGTNTLLPMD